MGSKLLASGVAALALLALASASAPANAHGHGGHGHGGSGSAPYSSAVRQFSSPGHVGVHHFRHHRRFAFVGVYPYAYDGDCYWLRRRALNTGSSYWWRRYYACRHGYY
jgi:hypothetical protein